MMPINVFWFRRDLRLEDNTGLFHALNSPFPVLPVFIFDTDITDELPADDARVTFIYEQLEMLQESLKAYGSSMKIFKTTPENAFRQLTELFEIKAVYANSDYEPYAIKRDGNILNFLKNKGILFYPYKDQVIFEKGEVLKSSKQPYTVFTPFKNQWLREFEKLSCDFLPKKCVLENLIKSDEHFPRLEHLGFKKSSQSVKQYNPDKLAGYEKNREIPALDATTHLGPHLRFGTVSIRQIINSLGPGDSVFLAELIWREFFMQILAHFPEVVGENFKPAYNHIKWRNSKEEFEGWCQGQTGYPLVDAGMRQLNQTGYMHNRVRMVVASFLCKHLLIDWRWGEAYFARKLLDYELSSNNGNWQWAAGTGCDAAPYFRVFNPAIQQKKFDPDLKYIRKWVPEFGTSKYPKPIVEHAFARERAIAAYKNGLNRI